MIARLLIDHKANLRTVDSNGRTIYGTPVISHGGALLPGAILFFFFFLNLLLSTARVPQTQRRSPFGSTVYECKGRPRDSVA